MAKYGLKTKLNDASIVKFLNTIEDETKRNDCFRLVDIMKSVTKEESKMWGGNIVGFGNYHYKYDNGHEGDMCIAGFAPRKQNITVYVMLGSAGSASILKDL